MNQSPERSPNGKEIPVANGKPLARAKTHRIRSPGKAALRKEYHHGEFERAERSANLAIKYPQLKTLTVKLLYFDHDIVSWGHGLKYRANLGTAKSLFRFNCPSALCKGGDFDLSKELRSAVVGRRKMVAGEAHCYGFRDQETGKTAPCRSILQFKMNLAFKT